MVAFTNKPPRGFIIWFEVYYGVDNVHGWFLVSRPSFIFVEIGDKGMKEIVVLWVFN